MHIFLQGPKRIGKSTVISRTLEIVLARSELRLGGFFTWNGGKDDPNVYMKPACHSRSGEIYRLASWNDVSKRLVCDVSVFERDGVRLLGDSPDADLLILDELGFLESDATVFKQSVMEIITGDIPVFGVLRLGDVPWHAEIKRNPLVTLYDVNEKNRDKLPQELAERLAPQGLGSSV